MSVTETPICWVHPRRCLVRAPIRCAEVRRTPAGTPRLLPPIGYDVGCSVCGFRGIWLQRDDVQFVEGPAEQVAEPVKLRDRTETIAYWRPASLSVEGSYECRRCKARLTIKDGMIVAEIADRAITAP